MATLAMVWSEWRVFSRGKLLSRVKIMSLRNRAVAEGGTQLGMALGPKDFRRRHWQLPSNSRLWRALYRGGRFYPLGREAM